MEIKIKKIINEFEEETVKEYLLSDLYFDASSIINIFRTRCFDIEKLPEYKIQEVFFDGRIFFDLVFNSGNIIKYVMYLERFEIPKYSAVKFYNNEIG